eukprot:186718-Prymnesium_polylepis.1
MVALRCVPHRPWISARHNTSTNPRRRGIVRSQIEQGQVVAEQTRLPVQLATLGSVKAARVCTAEGRPEEAKAIADNGGHHPLGGCVRIFHLHRRVDQPPALHAELEAQVAEVLMAKPPQRARRPLGRIQHGPPRGAPSIHKLRKVAPLVHWGVAPPEESPRCRPHPNGVARHARQPLSRSRLWSVGLEGPR